MSTAVPTVGSHRRAAGSSEHAGRSRAWQSLSHGRTAGNVPIEDWITFGLLGVMLVAVGWSVQLAEWGDLPSVIPTLLLGLVAGFIASRSGLPVPVKLILAATVGFAVIMWQGSIPADGSNVVERSRDGWVRFWLWVDVARGGGVSNDSVPFALMFMTASWVTAYTVTTLTYRIRSPWPPVVLLSIGLMSNLSFRPGMYEHTFYIFIIAAIALFAHLTAVRRMDKWSAQGISHPKSLSWLSMSDGLLFGGIVVLTAAILPLIEPRSSRLDNAWEILKAPIDALEEPANRLLSGVKAGEGGSALRTPNSVLTFKGAITLTEEPLAWVTSRYSTMFPGRVYDEYASTGWIATPQISRSYNAGDVLIPVPSDEGREQIQQLFQPLVKTDLVLPTAGIYSVDRDVDVEYLSRSEYTIPLTGAVGSLAALPDDVREFSFDMRFALRDIAARSPGAGDVTLNSQPLMTEPEVLRVVQSNLPAGIEVRLEADVAGLVRNLAITRMGPEEQVGVVMQEELEAEQHYTVTTFVSVADEEDLRASGANYPGWVKDRYLSLPASLPIDVRLLANEIIRSAGAQTPFEKMRAIQSFLQQQEYSLEIGGPSANKDGVYYFLFETQDEPCPSTNLECDQSKIKGYSQYYGSAGTVLLRAAGVPARMVAGWGAGEYVPAAGRFLIRDKDRHGWTQAYFTDYGWVDVEVTPGRDEPTRGEEFSVDPQAAGGIPEISSPEDDLAEQDLRDIAAFAEAARLRALQDAQQQENDAAGQSVPFQYFIIPIIIIGALILMYILWWFWHRGMTPAESTYTKMVRVGRLMGISRKGWQTPTEYAMAVGDAAPGIAQSAMIIAVEYERRRYAQPDAGSTSNGLQSHWRYVLRGLVGHRLRQLRGAGPELGEGRSTA